MSLVRPRNGPLRCIEGHTDHVCGLVMTPDSKQVVSGSLDKTIKVWDLSSGELLYTMKENSGRVGALAMAPDGQQVISGHPDGTVKVWDLSSGGLLRTIAGNSSVIALAMAPNGQQVVSGHGDGTVKVWDLSAGRLIHILGEHSSWIHTVAVTPDGQRIVSGSVDATIMVWDLWGGPLYTIEHGDRVNSVAVTPDGQQIVSGGYEYGGLDMDCPYAGPHRVKVWDLSSGKLLHIFKGDSKWDESVQAVAVAGDGLHVVSAYAFHVVNWNLKTGKRRLLFKNDAVIYRLALARNDRWISVSDHRGRIWIFELVN